MNLHRAEPAAGGNRVPGGAGALPCGPLWRGQPRCPPKVDSAALRAVPGSAHRRRCRDRRPPVDKACGLPTPGCLAFEKLNPGRGGGARRRAWTTASGCPPPPPSHPCPEPSGWVAEAAGARCAKARQGRSPGGLGCKPLPGSALGAAGTAQAKRAGGYGRPPGGLFMPVAGAQPRTRDLQVSSVLVSMLA